MKETHSLQLICNICFQKSVLILAGRLFGGIPGEGQELPFILPGQVQSNEQSLMHVLEYNIYILVDDVSHAFRAYHFKVRILKV